MPTAPPPPAGFLLRPPGLVMHTAALLLMLGTVYAFSAPDFYFDAAFIVLALWTLLAATWIIRALLCGINNLRIPRSQQWQKHWLAWSIAPLILLFTMTLTSAQVPIRIRFALSRSALTTLAQQAAAAGPQEPADNWFNTPTQHAGLYTVTIHQVRANREVDIRIPGTEFFRSFGGFVYCPSGPPNDDPDSSFDPLAPNWYIWHKSW